MEATVLTFPGTGRPRKVTIEGPTATLGDVLKAAELTIGVGENADLAVNGDVTADMATEVPDGATVTKTKRVEGA